MAVEEVIAGLVFIGGAGGWPLAINQRRLLFSLISSGSADNAVDSLAAAAADNGHIIGIDALRLRRRR